MRRSNNLSILSLVLLLFANAASLIAAPAPREINARAFHYRFESNPAPADELAWFSRSKDIPFADSTTGTLIQPRSATNLTSGQFNGRSSIAFGPPSKTDGFAENFTWEGFFLSPKTNTYQSETGIADRLITQFAFDKGDWTRLAIGLVADKKGKPRLCVELEGFDGRSFGMGKLSVSPDHWHHFALVHEGTASAATIRWFLDCQLCGELFLGGQADQNTLRPPGKAPFTIGARLSGKTVNRGFEGLIDEVRLTPRPLTIDEWLRAANVPSTNAVNTSNLAIKPKIDFWPRRHKWARAQSAKWPPLKSGLSPRSIDKEFSKHPINLCDDASLLRRLSLDVRGRIPSLEEIESFLEDERPDKRARLIDRFLASTEWGDGWVGYWQDLLAENPSVVFPTLNNSGPFRQWIYESFRDNKPFDRFATELILMENGSEGFALATNNDSPMAMRANVALKAFAGVDLKCARCHDSPFDNYQQRDLFKLAAFLNDGALKVPATSVAAMSKVKDAKDSLITVSLKPDETIRPDRVPNRWLRGKGSDNDLFLTQPGRPRAQLAALLTSPENSRFTDLIVNRVWARYFGKGLIDPVDDWNARPSQLHPELTRFLSRGLVESGYDLKSLARRILNSKYYQRAHSSDEPRRRLSAEQLADSLFVAVGKNFEAEVMGINATDPGAVNLPRPARAWQFAALPNERDRPALGMPVNQTIIDVMSVFGWNGNRQQPRSHREVATTALQPLILFNGILSQRIVRLSDRSSITKLCLADQTVEQLIDRLFLSVLSRHPNDAERKRFTSLLRPGFDNRRTGAPKQTPPPLTTFQPDWRRHLEAEQTRLLLAAQKRVAKGEPPTRRLTQDFRERVEDTLWALINSPEFVFIP